MLGIKPCAACACVSVIAWRMIAGNGGFVVVVENRMGEGEVVKRVLDMGCGFSKVEGSVGR
ncbi:MAG: hypothetical protein Q9N62_14095 [Ghiorsea sp.]|nr:hypothetical protein [Ghiorsea sp.]